MKMISLTFIACVFCASLSAPPVPGMIYIPEAIYFAPYEAIWNATCAVESNFNPLAIGDRRLRNKSYGIVQIRQSRLDDYFKQTGIRYTTKDMFDPVKSKQVFMFYASGDDMEYIARTWNGGPNGMNKRSTIEYWNKIKLKL